MTRGRLLDTGELRCSCSHTSCRSSNEDQANGGGSDTRQISQWARFPRSHQIGAGSFGTVFLCRDMLPASAWHHQWVAVKAVPLHALSDNDVALAMNEVAILRHLQHPNILRYVDSFIDDEEQMCLVAEYADDGDLAVLLRNCAEGSGTCKSAADAGTMVRRVDDTQAAAGPTWGAAQQDHALAPVWIESYRISDIVRQCLEALSYLHSNYIIHRDVKPANVYLTKNGMVKLGDFGVSKLLNLSDPMTATFIGTPFYLSPELCLGEPYSFGTDVWALGVLAYEMYCLKLPFSADNVLAQIYVVTEGEYDKEALCRPHDFSLSQQRELEAMYGDSFSQQEETLHRLVVALVERMLVVNPLQRPTAAQLLREFFVVDPSRAPSPALCQSTSSSVVSAAAAAAAAATAAAAAYSDGAGVSVVASLRLTDCCRISASTVSTCADAAALLASRVSMTYEGLVDLLPTERRSEVLQSPSRPTSQAGLCQPVSSLLQSSDGRDVDLDVAIRSATRHMISGTIEKIPWLRHAEAFSSLSLHEGYDNDVVRVDWMDEDHFSLVSPQKRRSLTVSQRPYDAAMASLEQQVVPPAVDHGAVGREDTKEMGTGTLTKTMTSTTKAAAAAAAASTAAMAVLKTPMSSVEGVPPPHDISLGLAAGIEGDKEAGAQQQQQQQRKQEQCPVVGRCQGLSTETLEAILRKKIMASYLRRQRELKALREASASREEEGSRQRAELNELYARSFSERRNQMSARRDGAGTSGTVDPPSALATTQRPNLYPSVVPEVGTATLATASSAGAGDPTKLNALERKLKSLMAPTYTPDDTRRRMDLTFLTTEVMRLAKDDAAVAERCATWAAHPPKRVDFTNTHEEDVERRSTSSAGDPQRGTDATVYETPVTLTIVSSEAHVTQRSTPPAANAPTGVLIFPICIGLKPLRRRTRLDGVVWRVKEALKAYGLDYALLFPLDIDDAEEVNAEELRLRYIDSVGDVVAVADASDWAYVVRDWRGRRNLPWMQLFMVVL